MTPSFSPAKQQTLHILGTGPDHDPNRGHLHVILTNKCHEGLHLIVPICTKRYGSDNTCLLGIGDHDFIKSPSFVSYAHAKQIASADIIKKINNGELTYRGPLEEQIFALVANGLETSMHISPKLKSYYKENKSN